MSANKYKIQHTAPITAAGLGEGLGLDSLGDLAMIEDFAATMP